MACTDTESASQLPASYRGREGNIATLNLNSKPQPQTPNPSTINPKPTGTGLQRQVSMDPSLGPQHLGAELRGSVYNIPKAIFSLNPKPLGGTIKLRLAKG